MTPKSLRIVAVLSLAVAACSSETATSTTVASTPTTGFEQVTSTTVPEGTPATAAATTTVAPTTTTDATPEILEIEISYESGTVAGGGRIEVPLGEPVVIRIDSDVADEGHLHGYDIFVDVQPGNTGVIDFVADIPGIFELELEGSGVLLADLEVAP